MPQTQKEWFLEERSRALAVMFLTRRDDLTIAPAGTAAEQGIHFLVNIQKPDSRSLRQFGVALDARVEPTTLAKLNRALSSKFRSMSAGSEYPYPVCLFYFTMQDNGFYYAWIAEPCVTEDGRPQLLTRTAADCKPLDRGSTDAIVEAVDRWYDAFYAHILASVR